ncbi:MAG: Nif3-like dinuclear metal center hexameric protein [Magnetococcus sp. WYHC-3]
MADLYDILHLLDQTLEPGRFKDYCPNGLQVAGRREITSLVTGVSACVALFERAAALGATMVFTHHGLLWHKDPGLVIGSHRQRLKILLDHDINLVSYHLPLDAHPVLGNNARLLDLLGLTPGEPFGEYHGRPLSRMGHDPDGMDMAEFQRRLSQRLGPPTLVLDFGPTVIRQVAIVSGAAPELIREACLAGADLFVTGEVSEPLFHFAREEGIHVVAAGHHRSETLGVQAVGALLAERFELPHHFVDIPNPL